MKILSVLILLLLAAASAEATPIIYNFDGHFYGMNTPSLGNVPDIGASTFLADFTSDVPDAYYFLSPALNNLFSGVNLRNFCFCAATLYITFNAPVYDVIVDFATIGQGMTINLLTSSGGTSQTSGVVGGDFEGGTLHFSSATPFTQIALSGGVFAIDNLRLDTQAVPEPRTALLLFTGILGVFALRRRLTCRRGL